MEREYKKSYKGFFLWLVSFVAATGLSARMSARMTENSAVLLTFSVTLIMLDVLLCIIYMTENIYWINGVTFIDAKKATKEARKAYAQAHLVKFFNATLLWGIYIIVKYFADISLWVDIVVFLVLVVSAAVSTVKIRLETT